MISKEWFTYYRDVYHVVQEIAVSFYFKYNNVLINKPIYYYTMRLQYESMYIYKVHMLIILPILQILSKRIESPGKILILIRLNLFDIFVK